MNTLGTTWQQRAVLKLCPDARLAFDDPLHVIIAPISYPKDPDLGMGLQAETAWRSAYNEILFRTAPPGSCPSCD